MIVADLMNQWTDGLGNTGTFQITNKIPGSGTYAGEFGIRGYVGELGITEPSTTLPPMNQQPGACPWCSTPWSATFHGGRCPKVRSIEYDGHGHIRRVEFYEEP